MATIYDVAKLASVSPKTVSRVLNGDAPVNAKTKEAVNKAIGQLGYVPSQAARMMRSNRSGIIGLITGAISQAPEPATPSGLPDLHIVQGVQREMAANGKILMIADTGGKSDAAPVLARTFAQHRIEGLVYVADHHSKVDIDLGQADCPVILVNCFDASDTPCVLPDDVDGEFHLVGRLIQAGHQRIGFLTLDPEMPAAQLRLEGYKAAHAAAGLTPDPELVAQGYVGGSDTSGIILARSLGHLLSLKVPPTAICCGNDEMAMRVYGLLRSRGVRVPEDISVAGYDDHRTIAEMLYPQLTTVELPYTEMGRQAARHILEMIGGTSPASDGPTLVRGPVVWRSSVTDLNSVET